MNTSLDERIICEFDENYHIVEKHGKLRIRSFGSHYGSLLQIIIERGYDNWARHCANLYSLKYNTYRDALIKDVGELWAYPFLPLMCSLLSDKHHRDFILGYIGNRESMSKGICSDVFKYDANKDRHFGLDDMLQRKKHEIIRHLTDLLSEASTFEEFIETRKKLSKFLLDIWYEERGRKYVKNRLTELKRRGKRRV